MGVVGDSARSDDLLDQLGAVDVSATADLSEIVFAEWEKPLIYAPATGPVPAQNALPTGFSPSRLVSPPRRPIPVGA